MKISVIIPAYNEEDFIVPTVNAVLERSTGFLEEVIIVDGGSSDDTQSEARKTSAKVITSSATSRASQMNFGASEAGGEILYFLHADTIPPENFDQKIITEVSKGNPAGCFRLAFDRDHFLLSFYAWCTRFDVGAFRFGDQSLFIKKNFFQEIGGFNENLILMEDNDIVKRIKGAGSFSIIPDRVTTSSRKYLNNGIVRLQLVFTLIFTLYKIGAPQSKLALIYKKLVH